MKDSLYMKHDLNAFQDDKIIWMRSEYGAEGYGLYWMLNEFLRNQAECKAVVTRIHAIAFTLNVDTDKLQSFVNDCIDKYELYSSDGESFWSERMVSDKQHLDDVRQKRVENGRQGGRPRKSPKPEKPQDPKPEPQEKKPKKNLPVPKSKPEQKLRESNIRREEREEREDISPKPPLKPLGKFENVNLTPEEDADLAKTFGRAMANLMIERLSAYKRAKGVEYDSDFAIISGGWVSQAVRIDIDKDDRPLKAEIKRLNDLKPKEPEDPGLTTCPKCHSPCKTDGETSVCQNPDCTATWTRQGEEWSFDGYQKDFVSKNGDILKAALGGKRSKTKTTKDQRTKQHKTGA